VHWSRVTPPASTASTSRRATTTAGSTSANSAVTVPASRRGRPRGCPSAVVVISASDRQGLLDDSHQESAHLIAAQDREQETGEAGRRQGRDRVLGGGHPGLGRGAQAPPARPRS